MSVGERIAIPTFASRVSPRFDCAHSILLVSIQNGEPTDRQEITVPNWTPHFRIKKLLELRVDTLICGSIDCWSAARLQAAGVTIYSWVTGEVEDAMTALLKGDLLPEPADSGCQGEKPPEELSEEPPEELSEELSGELSADCGHLGNGRRSQRRQARHGKNGWRDDWSQ